MTRAEAIHAAWTARVPKAVYYERDGDKTLLRYKSRADRDEAIRAAHVAGFSIEPWDHTTVAWRRG